MSEKLKQLREQIDKLDDELLKLANQRAALAQQIGHLKEDGVVLRPEREAQVLLRLQRAEQRSVEQCRRGPAVHRNDVAMPRAGSPADDRVISARKGLSPRRRH